MCDIGWDRFNDGNCVVCGKITVSGCSTYNIVLCAEYLYHPDDGPLIHCPITHLIKEWFKQ